MPPSAASTSSANVKVLCKCQWKCGGPEGAGKLVAYSTQTSHRRKDTANAGQAYICGNMMHVAVPNAPDEPVASGNPHKRRRLEHDNSDSEPESLGVNQTLDDFVIIST